MIKVSGRKKYDVIISCSICGEYVNDKCNHPKLEKPKSIKDIFKKPLWCPLKEKEDG